MDDALKRRAQTVYRVSLTFMLYRDETQGHFQQTRRAISSLDMDDPVIRDRNMCVPSQISDRSMLTAIAIHSA